MERDRTVIALDWDGHGSTCFSGRMPLSIEDLVSDLSNFMGILKIEKAILLAHSMSAVRGLLRSFI